MNEILSFFKDKKILITGHTGFKGSWLTQILLNAKANIIGYALEPPTNPSLFEILNLEKKVKNYFADIRDFNFLKNVLEKEEPEIVFHLAAQPLVRDSYDDPIYTYETNVMGTVNILQAIKEVKSVKAAVIITTDKVYKNKEWIWAYREVDELGGYDPYSTSKACAELVIKSYVKAFFNIKDYKKTHSTLIASTRAGNVIGGGDWSKDRLIPDIIKAIFEKKEKIVIRNPESIRPWQHVLEPLYGYLLLAKKLYEGDTFYVGAWNFAPNEENFVNVKYIVETAINTLKQGSYVIKRDTTKHEAKILKLDATKAKEYLKWNPILSLKETLNWTFDWYKNFYKGKNMLNFTNNQIKKFFEKINKE